MPQQQGLCRSRLSAHDQQPGQRDQRLFALRVDLQDRGIRLLGRVHLAAGAQAFGDTQCRFVPFGHTLRQVVHELARPGRVAGLILGHRQIEQSGRRGITQCHGDAQCR